jgi:hypothetical protein
MPPAGLGNPLMNTPRAATDVLLELISQLFDVYRGTHSDLDHHLLGQVSRQRMACVSAQVKRQDIEVALSHSAIVSARRMPWTRSTFCPQVSRYTAHKLPLRSEQEWKSSADYSLRDLYCPGRHVT